MAYAPTSEELNSYLFGRDAEPTQPVPQADIELCNFYDHDVSVIRVPAPKTTLVDEPAYQAAYKETKWVMDPTNPDRALSAGYIQEIKGQKIAVRITVPLNPVEDEAEKVVIKCSPWSNGVNDDVDAAEAVSLAASGVRVISISPMGIDKGSSKLTREQKRALKSGDFSLLAEAQIAAALSVYEQVFADGLPESVVVWGSSLGGSNAREVAAQLLKMGIGIDRLVIGSTPALQERELARLAIEYFKDGPKTMKLLGKYALPWREPADKDIYKKTMPAFLGRMFAKVAGHLWPAAALARGGEGDKIFNLAMANDLKLDFWVGEKDPISAAESWQYLAQRINMYSLGSVATVHVVKGAPHGVTSDATAITLMARRVKLGTK